MSEFTTEGVSPPERFSCFVETANRWHVPNAFRSDRACDFRAGMRTLDLGAFHMTCLSFRHLEIDRTTRHIRRGDTEALQFHVLLQGSGSFAQNGVETPMRPRQLVIADTSRPSRGVITAANGTPCSLVVSVPHRLLPLPPRTLRELTAAAIPLDSGVGAVTARWLSELSTRSPQFRPADVPALAEGTVELLTALLHRHTADPGARPQALPAEIHDFIRRHLHDPALTPAVIAAAHHISTAHLHRLFRHQELTVAASIQTQRLERLRRDLADPRLRAYTITALAARSGFTSATHAGRLFRRAYGTPPSDYRRRTLPR
ncbi:helix-turn-helix domain-containing protein [Streptomyces sp. NPDC051018]|uniref:AraC-like ligand-binding domain-containing protein n=1 Tax=Streptomyces sp. NPDC051018 TaxID=3365639 RepID=UPI0037A8B83D